jgi:NAD(P)-dependent dehydrogenase (short-subunit alcohol dehydrogenase family)
LFDQVAREIVERGGQALAIPVDVRDPQSLQSTVDQTVEKYKRLDVLVYNSGAIWWASVENSPIKRFQLMQRYVILFDDQGRLLTRCSTFVLFSIPLLQKLR